MNTSTRLILLLAALAAVVMTVAGYFLLHRRGAILMAAVRNELRAHALTLQIALEDDYRAGRLKDAERLIDRLRENSKIYSVILFDEEGQAVVHSRSPVLTEIRRPPEVRHVIASGETIESVRRIDGQEVFSIITPISAGGARRGAFEITQSQAFVQADLARAQQEIGAVTLALFAAIFFGVLAVTRYGLSRPINELLSGAAAIGRGDLDYRVIVPRRGGEFARLAREFNRMADSLAEQQRVAAHEVEERLGLERELRHSERLAAVGRLAAGVAHEMGAPLNVIDARAEQLLNRPDAPLETRQRNLTIIRGQAERITRIVRRLLNFTRPYHLRRRPVDPAEVVRGVFELIEAEAARAGVSFESAPGDGVLVDADPDLLQQVLLNLCLNGIQAMPAGGRLRVECMSDGATRDGKRFAAVRVSDTGAGIAPEHRAHLFEPFFTTKEAGQGTGLGLAVSRRVTEEHGGWIEAENRAEGGAAFTVYLPQTGVPPRSAEE